MVVGHRHCHVVAGLARADEIDVALGREVPGTGADRQDVAVQAGDPLDAFVGIGPCQGRIGDLEHDAPGFAVADRDQLLEVADLVYHRSLMGGDPSAPAR